jgi:ABC-type dipeptide/oligopeptide/nickel transport system ATPase component
MVPALHELPKGCKFADRCPRVESRCHLDEPKLEDGVRCYFPL